MKKRLLCTLTCIVLALTVCVGLFACDDKNKGKNTDDSFAMVSTWTTSGLVNHYNSNTNCTAYDYFVVEGLYRYVRSTDEIFAQLAEGDPVHTKASIDDYKDVIGEDAYDYYVDATNPDTEDQSKKAIPEVSVTTVKIRANAKWQNGEDFTAKDVWAYYYMIHPTSSNYMIAVKAVDDKTVQFVWNPLKEPNDTVKELLIAQDKSGTVKYDEFFSYVDRVYQIVMHSPVNTNSNLWGAFNRFSSDDLNIKGEPVKPDSNDNDEKYGQIIDLNKTRSAFNAYSPAWYIATGPFKPDVFSATQIKLVKNEHYWNAENIGFKVVKLYSSNDLNQTYNLISGGYVDYYDGFIQQDTLESMLDSNQDLVNLKMYDPGAIGITFNIKKPLMTLGVRKAFQYIFNREEIKDAANPYATVSYYPLLGMAASEAQTYMSEKHFNALTKYSYDTQKAEELLKAEGWTKENDGWYANGQKVKLTLACPSGHDISATAAEAAAAQLERFGIEINLLKTSNFYSQAPEENSNYDMMLEWTDLNMSFSYPTGSYNQFSNVYARWIHIDKYPENYFDTQKANSIKLVFNGLDGDTNKYEFADYINSFYSIDETELQYLVDVFNTGLAEQCFGIQFFQNVTASTLNVGRIKGVPLEEYWKENRNVTYVPQAGTDEFFAVARTNLVYATNYMLAYGYYQPNSAK